MSRQSEMAGPLAGFAPGFAAELVERGYRPRPAAEQLLLMGYVSGWLAARDLGPGDLTEVVVDEVMAARRASGRVHLISPRALVPLLEHLRSLGVVPLPRSKKRVAVTRAPPSDGPITAVNAAPVPSRLKSASSPSSPSICATSQPKVGASERTRFTASVHVPAASNASVTDASSPAAVTAVSAAMSSTT